MEETTYLFVDGAYLQRAYRDIVPPIFGDDYELDLEAVKTDFKPRKTFYYDCLDEFPRGQESAIEFSERQQQQRLKFDDIRSLGIHVHLGAMVGEAKGNKAMERSVDKRKSMFSSRLRC